MKALIIGLNTSQGFIDHDEAVRDQFIKAYNDSGGSITTSDVPIRSTATLDYQGGFDYCEANNIDMMVCSYVGASAELNNALDNYNKATLVMAAGGNTPGQMVFDYSIPQVICVTGAGDVTGNETSVNIEFFDNDYTTTETTPDEQDLSSFSNGYIAGLLKYISDNLSCTIWEARYRARMTGSENGVWDSNNGFGLIDVPSAIAFSGVIPDDPFTNPIEITFTASPNPNLANEDTILTWDVTGATSVTLDGVEVNASGSLTVNIATTTNYELVANNEYQTKTEILEVVVDPSLYYELEAGLTFVKIKFDTVKDRDIYRKVNDVWTLIGTSTTQRYEDTVSRSNKPIEYKIDDIEKEIMFMELKVYQR